MKARLSVLYFLQFGVWGCYLSSFGQMLGAGGLGANIAWFYAAIGLVSIITPSLIGRLADRTGRPERLLCFCHLLAAAVMLSMWHYCMTHRQLEFRVLYPLYICFLALYMPTMALANTTTFGLLARDKVNAVSTFPAIRLWGTVGFVFAMWFVNSAYWSDGAFGFTLSDSSDVAHLRFQYNAMQLLCSGIMGLATSLYTLTLPGQKLEKVNDDRQHASQLTLWKSVRSMQGKREIAVFLVFVAFSGVCLQISNGFVTPYITHFTGIEKYAGSLASGNATMLFSLSQIAEAACVLLVGISLKWKGIRTVYAIGLLAWSLRFFFLGTGNPGDGLWMLVGSMLVYGVAFNFITIAGHLYIQQVAPAGMKGFAQGLMMFMSNGIGATFGTLVAGSIVNKWCHWQIVTAPGSDTAMRLFMGQWEYPWYIFAAYSLLLLILWLPLSRRHTTKTPEGEEVGL